MKIKNFKPKNRFFLAPMAEINDIAFRLLCKKENCGLTYTGMINPLSKKQLNLQDKPAIQIFTNTTKGIKQFIEKYEKNATLFDFNLGCPAKNARKLGFGSFLNDLNTIEKILKIMKNSTEKPITIKIRKSEKAFEILKIAEKYCDAITIHPRTKEQGYSGEPDIKFAEKLKLKTNLPIIYSGDVNEKNAKQFLKKFDYLMIGRNAFGNPQIFSKLINKKPNTNFKDYLKLTKKYKLPFKQVKLHAMAFTKGEKGSRKKRASLVKAKSIKEIYEIMNFS